MAVNDSIPFVSGCARSHFVAKHSALFRNEEWLSENDDTTYASLMYYLYLEPTENENENTSDRCNWVHAMLKELSYSKLNRILEAASKYNEHLQEGVGHENALKKACFAPKEVPDNFKLRFVRKAYNSLMDVYKMRLQYISDDIEKVLASYNYVVDSPGSGYDVWSKVRRAVIWSTP